MLRLRMGGNPCKCTSLHSVWFIQAPPRLQVNVLGPALHVLLLLPLILKTAKQHSVVPRIVVVSSEMIFTAKIGADAIAAPNTVETLSSKEYCTPE